MTQSYLLARAMQVDHTTVAVQAAPLFHLAAYMWLLPTFLFGGVNVFLPRADPAEVCRVIADERVTTGFVLPPTVAEMVTDCPKVEVPAEPPVSTTWATVVAVVLVPTVWTI